MTTSSAPLAAASRSTTGRARWGLITILFFATAINYLDRTNMAVALPFISREFALSPAEQGLVLSAFAWTYAALQVPGGWLVDRIGARLSYGIAIAGWSVATALTGVARGFGTLLGMRMALGVLEAPAFPANTRLIAAWFPPRERARATSLYTAGEYIGLAVAVPLLSLLAVHLGWRSLFVVTGVLGLVFALLWFRRVRSHPEEHPRIAAAELAHIHSEDVAAAAPRRRSSWADLALLVRHRRLWGLYLGQFANGTVLYFFLTWFPTYLQQDKGFTATKVGLLGSVPYLAALVGVLLGGWWSDHLLRRGWSRTWARKLPIMASFVLIMAIFSANYVEAVWLLIVFMSLAMLAQGLGTQGWTLVAEMAPVRLLGLTGGTFNLFANLGGVLSPLVIGLIVQATGSFTAAIGFIAAVGAVGLLAYLLLVDVVERVPDRVPGTPGSGATP